MPILAREADTYPDDLFERPELGQEADRCWWALYTISRREKELMRRLRGLEVPFYCPLVPRRVKSPAGRVRESHVPLFSNYVFIYGDADRRYQAMTTNCISRWFDVPDSADLTHDLKQIHKLIDVGAPILPENRLEPGMKVRIRSGALTGVEGTVIKRFNETRLFVAVNFLKQGASVQIEDFELTRIY